MQKFLERLDSRNGRRVLLLLFLLTALTFSIVPLVNLAAGRGAKDYKLWYSIGQTVLHGGAIYPGPKDRFPFMYPPTAAEMLAIMSSHDQATCLRKPFGSALLN